MYKFVDISSLFPKLLKNFKKIAAYYASKVKAKASDFSFFNNLVDWAGDFGLYRGCAIEIQILKQYHAQHYTYVKQNTVNIVILLQLYQVLLK